MIKALRSLWTDDQGQGLVEYGMILGLVSVLAVTALGTLSTDINSALTNVAGKI